MHDYSGHEEVPDPEQMSKLHKLCDLLSGMDKEVRESEERLEMLKSARSQIQDKDLPDLMQTLGMKKITTSSGLEVELREEVRASFFSKEPERREPAFQWLKDNNHDGLIKNIVSVQFNRGEEDKADKLCEELSERGVNAQRRRDIHHQTLLAFIRERQRENEDIPLELFGAHIQTFARLKKG